MTISLNLPATDLLVTDVLATDLAEFELARPELVVPLLLRPRILGVGTATTPASYSQAELLGLLGITDPRARSTFLNSAIDRRHLTLPDAGPDGVRVSETQGQLLAKHERIALDMGARAVASCLARSGLEIADIGYLCCVTTTGFLTPGLSARLIRDLGIDPSCSRLDVVGMGCNAGLNALNAVTGWSVAHPGRIAVMVCMEACSAAYVMDSSMRTVVVNSLFGDGAAAVALGCGRTANSVAGLGDGGPAVAVPGPRILSFASQLIPSAIDAMRYDWDDDAGKFSFFLDPDIPYVVGAQAERVVGRLLGAAGLRRSDIAHWVVHSGGKKVIDAVRVNLGLSRFDLRHTTSVLRDYGNVSSGSFLFSFERLAREGRVAPGDLGVLMTMGPGSTIETALIQW